MCRIVLRLILRKAEVFPLYIYSIFTNKKVNIFSFFPLWKKIKEISMANPNSQIRDAEMEKLREIFMSNRKTSLCLFNTALLLTVACIVVTLIHNSCIGYICSFVLFIILFRMASCAGTNDVCFRLVENGDVAALRELMEKRSTMLTVVFLGGRASWRDLKCSMEILDPRDQESRV